MDKIEKSVFSRLIGVWKTEGIILTDHKNSELVGIDSYEFILDGNYILHKAHVKMDIMKSETFEIIELDNTIEKAKMYYYNAKGEKGVMTANITRNDFTINGDNIKFEGIINSENTLLIGKWYLLTEWNEWVEYIDLKLTKQNKSAQLSN